MRKAAAALAALAAVTFVPAAAVAQAPAPAQSAGGLAFSVTDDGEGRYETNVAGTRFTSRDEVEGYLLYRTAEFVGARGGQWFRFLHLPGERGAADHPAVRTPAFGAAYAHWQPHWTYLGAGGSWQPWRPEWGAPFWTETVGLETVERFEAHAMIEILPGEPRENETDFDSERVVADLRQRFDPAHRH